MEPIEGCKLITFSSIYPNSTEDIDELVKHIPSASALGYASQLLLRRQLMKIDERTETELGLLVPMLLHVETPLATDIINFCNRVKLSEYQLIDKVALHILMDKILANHNDLTDNIFDSKPEFTKFLKAYLICCDIHTQITESNLVDCSSEEDLQRLLLPQQIEFCDIEYSKDYKFEIIRICLLLEYLSNNQDTSNWVSLLLRKYNLPNWESYVRFLLDLFMGALIKEQDATPYFRLDSENDYAYNIVRELTVSTDNYHSSNDLQGLRAKPIYHVKDLTYLIMSSNMFMDKFYQSFLFDFANILKAEKNVTKIGGYPDLKSWIGDNFSESWLFYPIMNRCFDSYKHYAGKDIKRELNGGEPDFYVRRGNNLLIFEFKDVLLNADTKHSNDYDKICNELSELFLVSTHDKQSKKEKTKAKGVRQLLNVISNKLPVILSKFDKVESPYGFNVYPIIVYVDRHFGCECINNIVNNLFAKEQPSHTIDNRFKIKPLVMVPLEELTIYEDYFHRGQLNIVDLIESYYCEDKNLPFHKHITRTAIERGYTNKISKRFESIFSKHIEPAE
jgi:hypothetical protein